MVTEPNPTGAVAQLAPKPAALPPFWHPGRMLRRLAGVDEELLGWVPQERPRYTGLGGTVLSTATLAFLSMSFAIAELLGSMTPWVLLPAFVWFLVILNLDRWIVATPPGPNMRHRASVVFVRLLVAFVIGVVIAEPITLRIFATAIEQFIEDSRAQDLAQFRSAWENCNPVPPPDTQPPGCGDRTVPAASQLRSAQAKKAHDLAEIARLNQAVAPYDQELARQRENVRLECVGAKGKGLTGKYGDGPVCKKLTAAADEYEATHQIKAIHAELDSLNKDVNSQDELIDSATRLWAKTRADYIDQQVQARKASQGDIGLLERMDALIALAAQHGSLGWGIWAVRGLFILVDCAPALFKFFGGTTRYEALANGRMELGELEFAATNAHRLDQTQIWSDHQRDDLAMQVARFTAERASAREKIIDDLQTNWSRPMRPSPTTAPNGATLVEDFTGEIGLATLSLDHDDEPSPEQSGEPGWSPNMPNAEDLPQFRVVMVGGRGTGKTTLMAMMYHTLCADEGNQRGYWLACRDSHKRVRLNGQYRALAAAGREWPEPTGVGQPERFEFDCLVPGRGDGGYPILRVCYWDYAGELVTSGTEVDGRVRAQLDGLVRSADVVVMAIDGMRLRNSFAGPTADLEYAQLLVEQAQLVANAPCPIHLLVTKWDRLMDVHSIVDVQRFLRRIPAMRHLLDTRLAGGGSRVVRLIPVSVVGRDVVDEQQLDDGIVVMNKLRALEPINIDVPFAAMLPDRLRQAFEEIGPATVRKMLRRARRARTLSVLWGVVGFGQAVGRFVDERINVKAKLGPFEVNWGKVAIDDDPHAGWMTAFVNKVADRDNLVRSRQRDNRDVADELFATAKELRKTADWAVMAKEDLLARLKDRLDTFENELYPHVQVPPQQGRHAQSSRFGRP